MVILNLPGCKSTQHSRQPLTCLVTLRQFSSKYITILASLSYEMNIFVILKNENQIQLSMIRVKTNGRDSKIFNTSMKAILPRVFVTLLFSGFILIAGAQISTRTMMPDVNYPLLDKLIEQAKQNYPRTHAFEHRVGAQQQNLKKMKLGWFDIFTFTFLYSPNNSTTLVNPSILNGYQVGVFFNVGSLLKNKGMINQAKEELKVSEYERDEYYINITVLVKQRYFLYLQQLAILKVRQEAESDAESNMELFKHKYEKGEVSLDDYNKTLVNLEDRVQSKIESEGSVLVAKSSLEELVGKKLEEVN